MKKKILIIILSVVLAAGATTGVIIATRHKHSYNSVVTNPTCTEQGYTTHTCECGESYVDSYTNALNHSFTNYVFNEDATCEVNGTETAVCDHDGCTEEDTREKINSALSHSYGAWVSNNNGTHSKTCSNDATHKETEYCSGGTATCMQKATCNDCGESYGSFASHNIDKNYTITNSYHYNVCLTAECTYKENYEKHTFDKNKKCTVCEYVTTELLWTEITSDIFEINGTNLYVKVPNNQQTFYFGECIQVAEGATFKVYADILGEREITTYMSSIAIGDNVFYITVSNSGSIPKTYTVTIRRRPLYEVTFVTNGGSTVETQIIVEDFFATQPTTTRAGYTFAGWSYNFENPIINDTEITASWQINTYTIEYELNGGENHEDNIASYTIETPNITLQAPTKTGYTFNGWFMDENFENQVTEIALGSFGDVKIYAKWMPTIYTIEYELNGGNNHEENLANYTIETPTFELKEPTRAGYTFNGWFTDENFENQVTEIALGSFGDVKIYAKWTANTDTKYIVNYYLQNLENNEYTLYEALELAGKTGTTAYGETSRYEHFTYNESLSKVSGNIDADGLLVLNVYYTRNIYSLSLNSKSAGTVTNIGSYKYGAKVSVSATVNLGYEFVGWYCNGNLISNDLSYTFTVTQNVVATFAVKDEMANFNFTSTTTTCFITGIKAKTVKKIIVPDYVTSIGSSVFRGCSGLTEITLPFVGASASATGYESVFGYIFGYTTSSSGSSISGAIYQYYNGTYYHYYIPSSLKKVTITGVSIGSYAFYNCSSLTSVVIPDSVTSIGSAAFSGCSGLTSVVIGDSVISIGSGAFYNCSSLQYNIKDNIKYLGNKNNPYLYLVGTTSTTITTAIIDSNCKLISYDAFDGCYSLTSVVIPNSVTSIGYSVFRGCSGLKEVNYLGTIDQWAQIVFGNSYANPLYYANQLKINGEVVTEVNLTTATKVSSYAFSGYSGLTSVVIGDSVTSIGSYAFEGCSGLTSVEIPNSVTSIGNYAFYNCSGLTEITLPFVGAALNETSNTYFGYIFGASSYDYNRSYVPSSLKKVTITGGSSIGSYAFYNCSGLTSVVIGDSVTSIGNYAFYNCSGLTSVVIGDSVTKIGERAFSGCSGLTSVEIPNSVTSIGDWAFYNCSGLTSVVIPDSVTSIGSDAFYNCSGLEEITLPFVGKTPSATKYESVFGYIFGYIRSSSSSSILGATYQYYDSTTTSSYKYYHYYIPSSLKKVTITGGSKIADNAFYNCSGLTSVVIPDSVTSIGSSAFSGCSSLQYNIKDNIKYLGNKNNPYLYLAGTTSTTITTAIIDSNCKFIGSSAFYDCDSLTSVVIPNSVTEIGSSAFYDCDSLTSVVIGDSVTEIGYSAFEDCDSLTSVVIPNSVTSIGSWAFYTCMRLTSIKYKGTQQQWNSISKGSYWNSYTGSYTITYNYKGE